MMSFHRVLINIMKLHLIVNVPIHYQIQLYYLDFSIKRKNPVYEEELFFSKEIYRLLKNILHVKHRLDLMLI